MYQVVSNPTNINNNYYTKYSSKKSFQNIYPINRNDSFEFSSKDRVNSESHKLQNLEYLNEVINCIATNSKSKNPEINSTVKYIMQPQNAAKVFSKIAKDLKKQQNNDDIDNFYINQLDLSAEKLTPKTLAFNGLFHGKRKDIPFEDYFPADELKMNEEEFDEKVINILKSPQRKIFVEVINSELANKGASEDANDYIKNNKSSDVNIGTLIAISNRTYGLEIAEGMLALSTALQLKKDDLDDIDKGIIIAKGSNKALECLAVGGIITGLSAANHQIALYNIANPEPISKFTIWTMNGLTALACVAAKKIFSQQQQEAENKEFQNWRYVKMLHIAMQENILNSKNVGLAVIELDKINNDTVEE